MAPRVDPRRLEAWLAGVWTGLLAAVALVAAPAAFALLPRADAGRVAGRMLAVEAPLSLAFGVVLLLLDRARARREAAPALGRHLVVLLLALGCTVAGYYAILPLMDAARAGQGPWSFAALHAVSSAFYAVKALAVALLAWWLAAQPMPTRPS